MVLPDYLRCSKRKNNLQKFVKPQQQLRPQQQQHARPHLYLERAQQQQDQEGQQLQLLPQQEHARARQLGLQHQLPLQQLIQLNPQKFQNQLQKV